MERDGAPQGAIGSGTQVQIALTGDELAYCKQEALRRKLDGDRRKLNHASTYQRTDEERVEQETGGCCAEYACRKLLGAELELPFNTFHKIPDILPDFEVRHTGHENGRLIVRSNDADDRRYILATGTPPEMTVRGWLWGHEAKQDKFRWNPYKWRSCWGVPQHQLYDLIVDISLSRYPYRV